MSRFVQRCVLGRHWRRLLVEPLEERTVLAAAILAGLDELTIDRSLYHPSRLLVGLQSGSDSLALSAVLGQSFSSARPLVGNLWEFDLGGGMSVADALPALLANPLIAYAEPDYTLRIARTPNDSQFASQWSLNNSGQTGGTADADIDAPEAWDLTTGISSTIVAVIDTGVDFNHPDLAANMWVNPGEIPGDGVDNDANGFVDDVHGYDFINEDGSPLDDQGHGTHVAGTIGAVADNGVGVAGINWNVQIMALKFLGADGSGSTSDAIRALNYAVQMGAQVSNNSYGDTTFSQAFRDALENARQADHIFVAAAGNSSSNNDAAPFYPANYDVANVISVAASDHNDRLASFSNYGRQTVDLAAPGVNILSTTPNNTYTSNSGTSMASPHVAGVVSLVAGLHPTWNYQAIIDQVLNSVDFVPGLEQFTATGGRLNAARAVGVPDLAGPRIIATDPPGATAGPIASLRVTFNEPLNPETFTTADVVSFTGPGGSIAVTGISAVAGSPNRKFEITFASQIVKGDYEMVLGPSILDTAGNAMNQDNDATNGEVPDDRFTARLVIGDVHVATAQDVPVTLVPFTTSRSYIAFDQNLSIADLDVQVDISIPDAGLLTLTLVSPGGTRIPLSGVMGFLGPNFEDTIFDDEAATPIESGSPPFSGSYQPNSPLSVLDGTSSLGTWTLEVGDNWFDFGTLNAWSLSIIAHPPRVTISDVALSEGDSGTSEAVFTISLSNVVSDPVTVDFATANGTATAGSDYVARSGTLTFAPGEQTKTVSVTVLGDSTDEPTEDFFLDLANVSNATLTDPRGMATIYNDEARLSINDVGLVEGNSGTATANFVVSLATASNQTVSVSYATANVTANSGSDYTSTSGTLTFLPGETSKSIAVTVNGDVQNELAETWVVNLTNQVHAVLSDSQGVGTITNDDPLPALSLADVKTTEGNTGTKNLNFIVGLSAASGRIVTVQYAALPGTATPGSDYTAASGTLTFNPGQISKTVSIVIAGDTLPEADETLLVSLSSASGAVLLDGEAVGTIQNDDTSLSIGDATLVEGDTGVASVTFTVSLSAAVGFEVLANYAAANGTASAGSDFVTASGTLAFSPGQTSQTVTVLVLNDLLDESAETVLVNLSSPVSALVADGQGVATITDNDPLPSLSISDPVLAEGNSGTKNLTFAASLSAASGRSVTVQYTTVNGSATAGSDYIAKSGTLTIPAGSVSQSINVTLNGDTAAEPDETLSLAFSNPTNATLADSEGLGKILDDDNLSLADVTVVEGNGGLLEAILTLRLANPLGQEVRVDFATANGSATAASDYVTVSGTAVFAPGVTIQTIVVPILSDRAEEGDETINLNLSNPVGLVLSDTQGVVTITDDDELPALRVADVIVAEGNSGTKNLAFVVTLSAASNRTVTVQYATANGTATAGSDYTAKSGTLTFFAGTTSQTINVTVSGDTAIEAAETVLLNLFGPSNATLDDDQGVGTIAGDDPLPLLAVNDVKATEGQSGTKSLSFSVTLSSASTSTVTVDYATAAGTATPGADFTAAAGTLTFTAGQTSKLVTMTILGDSQSEPDETFTLNLTSATGAVVLDGEGQGTIQNDDTTIAISNATVAEGHSGSADATFIVSLSAAAGFEVRVNYATANSGAAAGSDFVGQGGTLVFAPGQTTQPVTVQVLGDGRDETDESLLVNLTVPTNAQLADSQGLGTIVDDDATPALSIGDASLSEGNSGTKNLYFTVSLSAISGRSVTVQYATGGGTAASGIDYQPRSGTLTIPAGFASGTITVPLVGDTLAELDETFFVTLSSPTGATLADNQALGTIWDDDNLSIGDVAIVEGDSGTTNAVIAVALAVSLPHEVRLEYATANGTAAAGSDYAATSGTVVFAPGQLSQMIIIPIIGDRLDEADETVLVNLQQPVGVVLVDTQAVATITDNDPLPRLSINNPVIVEGNTGTKNLTFAVSLSEASGRSVSVQYATADSSATAGSDYVAKSGTLTFLPGSTSQNVTVTINGDSLIESDELLFVNLSNATNGTIIDSQGEGRLLDDDAAGGASGQSSGASVLSFAAAAGSRADASWLLGLDSRPERHSMLAGKAIGNTDQPANRLSPAAVDLFMLGLAGWMSSEWEALTTSDADQAVQDQADEGALWDQSWWETVLSPLRPQVAARRAR